MSADPSPTNARSRKSPREFNRALYEKELIDAGFDPKDAAMIAEKTAQVSMSKIKRRTGTASVGRSMGSLFDKITEPLLEQRAPKKEAARRKTAAKADGAGETPAAKPRKEKRLTAVYDYRTGEVPQKVRDLLEAHLAIEAQDAKSAGTLGFMTRSLAIATLPHRRLDTDKFVRRNGDFTLTMLTAHPLGLPYGTLPRLLLTWVCSEVVDTKEPVLFLGARLANFLAELGLHNSGGERGDITRLKHAMTTLFSSIISCSYEGKESWALQNVLLADRVEWWQPQASEEAGAWQSRLQLSQPFFRECIDHPLPVDMRAVASFRSSPLELDIYFWLTHRMSYLSKRTTIPWVALKAQFGSAYADNPQGLRDFRRAFLRSLKAVHGVYQEAVMGTTENGLVLHPSPTHVPMKTTPKLVKPKQPLLPFR